MLVIIKITPKTLGSNFRVLYQGDSKAWYCLSDLHCELKRTFICKEVSWEKVY